MKRYEIMMLYGVTSLFISSVLISHFGALRGIYVLSANLTVLVPWLSLMALGSSGRANEFQRRVVLSRRNFHREPSDFGVEFWSLGCRFEHNRGVRAFHDIPGHSFGFQVEAVKDGEETSVSTMNDKGVMVFPVDSKHLNSSKGFQRCMGFYPPSSSPLGWLPNLQSI